MLVSVYTGVLLGVTRNINPTSDLTWSELDLK